MLRVRSAITFSNVAAMLALFIALGGGAYAAIANPFVSRGGAILGCVNRGALEVAKSGRHCPKHTTSLTFDQTGPRGATGPQGIQGSPGAAGAQGLQGDAGPLLAQLPSGKTERGVYDAVYFVTASEKGGQGVSISFPIPLAAAPVPELIPLGSAPTADCPGSATAPTAAPGHLCVYESAKSNVSGYELVNPENDEGGAASRFGLALYVEAGSSAGLNGFSVGTWAVTAP